MATCIASSSRMVLPRDIIYELKACKNLESIKKVEAAAVDSGINTSISVANTLISMYAKHGSLRDARQVFDKMQENRSVISWNTLILGYAENGEDEQALELLELMLLEGCEPNYRTFVTGLKACIHLAAKETAKQVEDGKLVKTASLQRGMAIHVHATDMDFDSHTFVGTSLINMYSNCGCIVDAERMFESMQHRSVVSWNSLLLGYAENGEGELAMEMFARMRAEGFDPDSATFVAVLKACIAGKLLEQGICIHFQAATSGCDSHIQVANILIDMYGKLGAVKDAATVFEKMKSHTVVSWTSLMHAYAENGQGEKALELFSRMEETEGSSPDVRCYIAALKACGKHTSLENGCAVHSRVASWTSNTLVDNVLIDMYAKWGCMQDARRIFDKMVSQNTVSWTSLISGYVAAGEEELALELFDCMRSEGFAADSATIVAALKACTALAVKDKHKSKTNSLEKGVLVHLQAYENNCESQVFVENTLVDMYAKCGSMVDAVKVFDSMARRTVVSWTALMAGYADNGEAETSLKLFADMRAQGYVPDNLCFVAVLRACSLLASLELGKEIHADIRRHKLENDLIVANSLLYFYGKCGSMAEAQHIFESMRH